MHCTQDKHKIKQKQLDKKEGKNVQQHCRGNKRGITWKDIRETTRDRPQWKSIVEENYKTSAKRF